MRGKSSILNIKPILKKGERYETRTLPNKAIPQSSRASIGNADRNTFFSWGFRVRSSENKLSRHNKLQSL